MKIQAPHFITFLLMISFASVNAVLFTPSLPAIAKFFSITDGRAQLTITCFLIGYAIGQLIYGPLANRFGRKKTLYAGIFLQILSSLFCAFSGIIDNYSILVLGRFLLALGSGVGLKMTFTLVNEIYEPKIANQKLSYLMIAFAITPGLAVMLGGFLSMHYFWTSTFYAGAIYGIILFLLVRQLPETKKDIDLNALKLNHLINGYISQFKNSSLIIGGLLMGGATCFVYVFAAMAPFIAINMMHMNTSSYGTANVLPSIGLVIGSLLSAQLSKKYQPGFIVNVGIYITFISSLMMLILIMIRLSALFSLFIPMMFCYFGLALVFANASIIAMSNINDRAHGSAIMNFINMGLVTCVVLSVSHLQTQIILLPTIFIFICLFMIILYKAIPKEQ